MAARARQLARNLPLKKVAGEVEPGSASVSARDPDRSGGGPAADSDNEPRTADSGPSQSHLEDFAGEGDRGQGEGSREKVQGDRSGGGSAADSDDEPRTPDFGPRTADFPVAVTNAALTSKQVRAYCKLSEPCQALLARAVERLGLSARAYERIRKVARTIADLDGSEDIEVPHLAEAIQYRSGEERLRG